MSKKTDLVTLATEIVGCCENVAVRKESVKMLGEKSVQLVKLVKLQEEESQYSGAASQTWLEDPSSILNGILEHIQKWSSRGSVVQWLTLIFLGGEIKRCHQDLDEAIRLIKVNVASDPALINGKITPDSMLNTISNVLSNQEKINALLQLKDGPAQLLIDFMYAALSQPAGRPPEPRLRKDVCMALYELMKTSMLYPHWYVLKNTVHQLDEDASGGFCDIHRGNQNGLDLCLKIVRINQPVQIDQMFKVHAKEMILWSQLRHPNVVPFYGVQYLDGTRRQICFASPWMDNGNIVVYLKRNPSVSRTHLISDIADGLKYLHDKNVVHGDLKAVNVLVSGSGRPCIADFGISAIWTDRALNFTTMTSGPTDRSIRWAAPELFEEGAIPNRESDIWAFGCVCYEVLTGKLPYHDCTQDYQIVRRLITGERPAQPGQGVGSGGTGEISDEMWKLLDRCWSFDLRERATYRDLLPEHEIGRAADEDMSPSGETPVGSERGSGWPSFSIEDPFAIVNLSKVQEVLAGF